TRDFAAPPPGACLPCTRSTTLQAWLAIASACRRAGVLVCWHDGTAASRSAGMLAARVLGGEFVRLARLECAAEEPTCSGWAPQRACHAGPSRRPRLPAVRERRSRGSRRRSALTR